MSEPNDASQSRSPIQVTQLRAFVAVARIGSLTGAAQDLAYTEPAVHLQLAGLSRAMGGKLFVRARRRMELTPLGAALLPHASAALESIDEMTLAADRQRAMENHVIRIGVGRSTGSYLFPHLAAAVQERHPEIVLEPSLMPVGDLYQSLARGELDIVYASSLREQRQFFPEHDGKLTTVPFRRYTWHLAASPRLAARIAEGGSTITVFVPEYAHALTGRIEASLPAGNSYIVSLAQDAEATKGAALADMGVACVPAYTARFEVVAGSLVRCFADLSISSMIYVGHERRPRHPDVARMVAATRRLPSFSVDGASLEATAGVAGRAV